MNRLGCCSRNLLPCCSRSKPAVNVDLEEVIIITNNLGENTIQAALAAFNNFDSDLKNIQENLEHIREIILLPQAMNIMNQECIDGSVLNPPKIQNPVKLTAAQKSEELWKPSLDAVVRLVYLTTLDGTPSRLPFEQLDFEMFARQQWSPEWTTWGFETKKFKKGKKK